MEFRLRPIFVFLTLLIAASHAALLLPEAYWNSVLPNTPMPGSLRTRLQQEFGDGKNTAVGVGKAGVGVVVAPKKGKPGTSVNVGKGGVGVHTGGKVKPGGTSVNVGKGGVGVHTGGYKGKPGTGTGVVVGKGPGVGVSTGKPGHRTNVGVGKGGVSVHAGSKGKPVVVGVKPGANPFVYRYAASEDQLKDNPNVALFFLEKDLHAGTQMNLQFTKTTNEATFLPRAIADNIPFSSNKLPEILNTFSVQPESEEAESMKTTVKECEEPSIVGEEKYCATSLESMVDFSTSKLGKNVQVVATEAGKDTGFHKYTIATGVSKVAGNEAVVCHDQKYAYSVFYCHKTKTSSAYVVPLVSDDGVKVKAVAVCHKDTSAWNPKHLAFKVLKVQPGTVPICHFLPEDHVVWVAK